MVLIIQQLESNLITPRVISQSVGLHPLLVMFSVMFFGAIMGIPGMILGVPLMAVMVTVMRFINKQPEAQPPAPPEAPPQPEGETT